MSRSGNAGPGAPALGRGHPWLELREIRIHRARKAWSWRFALVCRAGLPGARASRRSAAVNDRRPPQAARDSRSASLTARTAWYPQRSRKPASNYVGPEPSPLRGENCLTHPFRWKIELGQDALPFRQAFPRNLSGREPRPVLEFNQAVHDGFPARLNPRIGM